MGYVLVISVGFQSSIAMFIRSVNWTSTSSVIFSPILFTYLYLLLSSIATLLGSSLCAYPCLLIWSSYKLLLISLTRTTLIPLFLMCNVHLPGADLSSAPPIINSDVMFLLLVVIAGVSDGYTSTLCMMAAPSLEHNPGLKEGQVNTAAAQVQLFFMIGITAGSLLSFGIRAVSCQCNPF